jgi:cytochrome P450
METYAKRYGDCFTVRPAGYPPCVFVTDPEAVKQIFTSEADRFPAAKSNAVLEPMMGQHSLFLLDGPRHLRERKLMVPPFHGERMQAYGEIMRASAEASIENWPVGRSFRIHPPMLALAFETIVRTVFGLENDPRVAKLRQAFLSLLDITTNPLWLQPMFQVNLGPFTPWGRLLRLRSEINILMAAEIGRRRAEGCERRRDILSMLIEARYEDGTSMTDDEIRDEMLTLLVAGHETTASGLAWTIFHVLRHPDVLKKIRQELREVVGDGRVTIDHLANLVYLDATIKESLRITPVVPAIGRHLAVPMSIGGHELPAGCQVAIPIYLVHRRPGSWSDPERFVPERFLNVRPSPYEYLPFGGGTRRCIGMAFSLYEMKVVLAEIFQRVEMVLKPGYHPHPVHRSVFFVPSGGVPVIVQKKRCVG